jgi:hypothetical protein
VRWRDRGREGGRERSPGMGVRMPATTSSPWAFCKNSPKSIFSPVAGLRVKQTPVPEVSAVILP